jgi:putative transposase
MVEGLCIQYPVRELCLVLEVTRSGYYAWRRGEETAREAANRLLTEEIRRVYQQKKGRYGSPRITEQLRRDGHRCNHKRVERLMRKDGLRGCSSRKRRVCTTDSNHDQPVALRQAGPTRSG